MKSSWARFGLVSMLGACARSAPPVAGRGGVPVTVTVPPAASPSPEEAPPVAATTAASAAAVPEASGDGFQCFAWVHQGSFSTDCYRSPSACERARAENTGADSAPCRATPHAVCTTLSRPPATDTFERCFDGAAACARYAAFVRRSGHVTTPCAER